MTLRLRLTLDATYDPHGISEQELRGNLEYVVQYAMSAGLLTGETEAEVDTHSYEVTTLHEPVDGIYRCIVACNGCNGPDLFFVKVHATQDQYDDGFHYEAAKTAACEEGYDVHERTVVFDENDAAGRAMLGLFEWDSASVVESPLY